MELSIGAQRVRRRLRIVRWVAIADAILLVALVSASLSDNRQLVSVLGPLHGGNFLLLLVLTGTGAADGLWRWWFPALVLVTAGPPGALLGEWLVGRRLDGSTPDVPPASTEQAARHVPDLEQERRTPQ